MSGTSRAGSYRSLLIDETLRRAFLVSLVGRFGYALLPLCLLFSISNATASFALAATATAVFGVSGLVMPIQARLIDRFGQRRVLPWVGLWFFGFLVLASAAAYLHVASPRVWIPLCLVGGLGAPSLGPSMRAQWREATTELQRPSAYSLDAIAEEMLFLAGPLAASVFLATGPAWRGLVLSAVLIPIGVLGLITSSYAPDARQVPATTHRGALLGPLRRSGFRRLLLVMAAAGFAMSAALTVVAGEADRLGRPSIIGLVEAATGVASVLGAWWWGRRPRPGPWQRQLAILLALRVPLVLLCVVHPSIWTLAVTFAVAGVATAPTYVVAYAASDHESDSHHHTEASTWVTSVNNIGISLGTATAGWLFIQTTISATFAVVAVVLALAVFFATVTGSLWPLPTRWSRKADGLTRSPEVPTKGLEK